MRLGGKAAILTGAMAAGLALWACSAEPDTAPLDENPGLDSERPDPLTPEEEGPDVDTPPDGGSDEEDPTADAGTEPDGGTTVPFELPTAEGWQFFGTAQGGPAVVYGASQDEGGNIWVAGGEDGLFLLAPGATQFRRFTMAEGLRPYGYMPDGSVPPGAPYLKVISVAGGPNGTAFVGYEGKKVAGKPSCESEWDVNASAPDPSVYKSGDADRVTLNGEGISVVHYDIFSGPGVVAAELRGREKLCDVKRLAYDATTQSIWFGANHGFARGRANFAGNPTCNGQRACEGVEEHMHPFPEKSAALSGDFLGVAPDARGNVWVGGDIRSTLFKFTDLGGFWPAQSDSEFNHANQFHIWPDAAAPRNKDVVSDMAVGTDGTVWVSSFWHGVAQLNASGAVLQRLSGSPYLPNSGISALVADTDGSVWFGGWWGGGLTRLKEGHVSGYGSQVFGFTLANQTVSDIQVAQSGGTRRLIVSFLGDRAGGVPGAIGIYSGP